ncbi:synaptotagmin-3-like [Rutidosis leptorrhynchoides]|uniref:synaptotagmin-3-like n=1 Tax=Rutidosis leptorrhynchoides TaxID=125765 RepID=UPI003A99736B
MSMNQDHLLGKLIVHIHKGVDLAIRDLRSSDPYVIIRMGEKKLKTKVVKRNLNPVWDEYLTLPVVNPLLVKLEVYDWDLLSADDKMGDAEFDFTPFSEAVKAHKNDDHLPNNTIISTVKPTRTNCLAEESDIIWTDGRIVQNMVLRLRNVERGELEIKLSWNGVRDSSDPGLLSVYIHKGVDLAIRDLRSSDPYVIIRMGEHTLKSKVVKKNLNPVWDEDFTLTIGDPLPIKLEVYDRDLLSADDKMGDAEFDITPFLEAVKAHKNDDHLPNNTIITTVKPTRTNCLAEESDITWTDGRIVQNMVLRLRNVERGELEIKLSWISAPGSRQM